MQDASLGLEKPTSLSDWKLHFRGSITFNLLQAKQARVASLRRSVATDDFIVVGGLVAIFYFPIYWVSNHPN